MGGSGAFVFFPPSALDSGSFVDLGAPLGPGTNNLGELWAISIAVYEVLNYPFLDRFENVFIFTDSKFAIPKVEER